MVLPGLSSPSIGLKMVSIWKGGTSALPCFSGPITFSIVLQISHYSDTPGTSLFWFSDKMLLDKLPQILLSMFVPPWNIFLTCHKATETKWRLSSYVFSLWFLSLGYLPKEWNFTLLVYFLNPNITLKCTIIYFLLLRKWSISDKFVTFINSGLIHHSLHSCVLTNSLELFSGGKLIFFCSHYSFSKYFKHLLLLSRCWTRHFVSVIPNQHHLDIFCIFWLGDGCIEILINLLKIP